MNSPLNKLVLLDLGGVFYTLLFDFEAIAYAEDMTGRALLSGITPKEVTSPTISLVRAMLYAAIHTFHPTVTFDEAKALITRKNFVNVWTKLLEAWMNSWSDEDEDDKKADPPTDQR